MSLSDANGQSIELAKLRLLSSALVCCRDAVIVTEAEPTEEPYRRIVYVNPAFTRLTGYSAEEALGRSVQFLQSPLVDRRTLDAIREAQKQWGAIRCELLNRRKDGSEHWVEISMAPVTDDAGRFTHWVSSQRDITERRRMLDDSARNTQKLSEALRRARLGSWDLDFDTGRFTWNEEAFPIFGFNERDGPPSFEVWLDRVHPDDRPTLSQMLEKAKTEGEPYKLDHRLVLPSGDERVVSAMGEPVRNAAGAIVGLRGVVLDVTDRVRAAEQLRTMMERAEAQTIAKSAFLANMSHEIRTPMNGVVGTLDLLLASDLRDEQRQLLAISYASALALLELLDNVLDLSKIDAGRMRLNNQPFDLRHTILAVTDLLRQRADAKSLELITEIEGRIPPRVRGDEGRLRQVLLNLVGNALKFTLVGSVSVRARVISSDNESHMFRFEIEDTGIGIPSSGRDRLFQRFSQVDASSTRRFGGTGLGLSICREIVGLMGGSIGVDSEDGVGSTFWFTVRLAAQRSELRLSELTVSPSQASPANRTTFEVAPGTRVLLCEDHPVNREVARMMLEPLGLEVDMAEDGQEAVAAFGRARYDIVLMDCQMPTMDGYEATAAIRRTEVGDPRGRVPIIALTAHAMQGDREHCIAAGMDDYLAKPITREALWEVLKRWLSKGLREKAAAARRATDADPMREPRKRFIEALATQVEELAAAQVSGSAGSVRMLAQRLHGTAVTLGFAPLGEAALALENTLINDASLHLAESAVGRLRAAMLQLIPRREG